METTTTLHSTRYFLKFMCSVYFLSFCKHETQGATRSTNKPSTLYEFAIKQMYRIESRASNNNSSRVVMIYYIINIRETQGFGENSSKKGGEQHTQDKCAFLTLFWDDLHTVQYNVRMYYIENVIQRHLTTIIYFMLNKHYIRHPD